MKTALVLARDNFWHPPRQQKQEGAGIEPRFPENARYVLENLLFALVVHELPHFGDVSTKIVAVGFPIGYQIWKGKSVRSKMRRQVKN